MPQSNPGNFHLLKQVVLYSIEIKCYTDRILIMEVESPRALFNADKDYFLKTIAARRSQLQKQPWFSDYQGYLLNHQGRMYSYTVCQGEERPRIDHIRGLPGTDPLAAFFDEIHLGEKIRVWNAVSSLSRSEMSRHKREGLMDGVNPDLIENLVTDYQEAVTRLLGANPKLIDQPSRILHRIVIQHGIFEMEDIISAVNHYNSTNETETGVTPELRMERSCLLHNAAAVASVYNMGTYMWEKDRWLEEYLASKYPDVKLEEHVCYIGDHENDIPLLEKVGLPLVINPKTTIFNRITGRENDIIDLASFFPIEMWL